MQRYCEGHRVAFTIFADTYTSSVIKKARRNWPGLYHIMTFVFWYFSRNSVGLHPFRLRNRRLKLDKVLKPVAQHISETASVVSTNLREACPRRMSTIYSEMFLPVRSLK